MEQLQLGLSTLAAAPPDHPAEDDVGFRPGDTVHIISGGFLMIVEGIDRKLSRALCWWLKPTTEEGPWVLQQEFFPITALIKASLTKAAQVKF